MNTYSSELRRRQLDRQLSVVREALPAAAPQNGWIRSIREALGLTLEGLGKRLGVSRQTAFQLETAEVNGSITLKRLRAAADAMHCDVAIVLVPRASLEATLRGQALEAARKRVKRVAHTMMLEAQTVSPDVLEEMAKRTAEEMIAKRDPAIWE